jgi:hypothetical protein
VTQRKERPAVYGGKSREIAVVKNGIPYNGHRQKLVEKPCDFCGKAYLSVNSSKGRFCSLDCRAEHVKKTGQFAGENNPRWLGGVSNDNMRYRVRQMERWPERDAARKAVQDAVRAGKLIRQPCEKCGELKSEGHHDDYTKPLEVRWLCRTHHTEHHTNERRLARVRRVEAKRP